MMMLEKTLLSLALALVTAGCGTREEASSGEMGSRGTTAKRWRPDPSANDAPPDHPPSQERLAEQPPERVAEQPRAKDDPASAPADLAPADDRPDPAAPPDAQKTEHPAGGGQATNLNPGPGIVTLSTDDCDAWPSYDWPLEMKIEVLEFPARITKPSPPIPDD